MQQFTTFTLAFIHLQEYLSTTMTENKPELDPLAPRIEEALLLSGMSATQLGYTHFGDPAFVLKMRRGRQFRPRMAEKVETFLKEFGC